MSLALRLTAFTTRIANYLRDSVVPRLLPTGGTDGQAVVRVGTTAYGWATLSTGGGTTTPSDNPAVTLALLTTISAYMRMQAMQLKSNA